MILTERNSKLPGGEREGLEFISAEDYFTGSRYVKGLENIELILAG